MSVEAAADRIAALLAERPRTFYDLLRQLDDLEYRTILRAWGALRERRALGRDEHGNYRLETEGRRKGAARRRR